MFGIRKRSNKENLESERDISHTALGDCFNDARAMQLAYYLNEYKAC